MGAEAYWYRVSYKPDLQDVLNKLRQREFEAGRYNPVLPKIDFSEEGFLKQRPGAKHKSPKEDLEASDADGTRSILDIEHISEKPAFGAAAPLSLQDLKFIFRTEKPTWEDIKQNLGFFENIGRGHCVYIILYKDDKPDEIFFAGFSCD